LDTAKGFVAFVKSARDDADDDNDDDGFANPKALAVGEKGTVNAVVKSTTYNLGLESFIPR
jgi:hypothetical protein